MATKRSRKPDTVVKFADLSSSTELYNLLGDEAAQAKIAQVIELLRAIVIQHRGRVVKTIGDEVLVIYTRAEDALRAAIDMHRALNLSPHDSAPQRSFYYSLRIGMHAGPVIFEANDVFGQAVNIAAHIVNLAKPHQILVTRPIVERVPAALRAQARLVDRLFLRGNKRPADVFELPWQMEEMTVIEPELSERIAALFPGASVRLRSTHAEITLSDRQPFAILGRSESCDLTVDDKMASRHHVRIEYRRGKFYIIDHSSNGTYVRQRNGTESFLCREEAPLPGNGQISLGRSFAEGPDAVVDFDTLGGMEEVPAGPINP